MKAAVSPRVKKYIVQRFIKRRGEKISNNIFTWEITAATTVEHSGYKIISLQLSRKLFSFYYMELSFSLVEVELRNARLILKSRQSDETYGFANIEKIRKKNKGWLLEISQKICTWIIIQRVISLLRRVHAS